MQQALIDAEYCHGCKHYYTASAGDGAIPSCVYILNKGRRRPCKGGKGCTEHTDRESRTAAYKAIITVHIEGARAK